MPRDQDLRYAVKVQDAQLKELSRNLRAINKELSASEKAGGGAGSSAAAGYASADREAKKARASATAFGSATKDAFKFGVGAAVGFEALSTARRFFEGSIPAAQESERSLARLETQLDATGLANETYVGTIEKAVRAQTLMAGVVDDELVRDSLTNLLRSTRNVTRAIELNALALDISIAKNISLETASRLVARVYAGNTGALGRYGITIDKTASSTEALTILQARFAGQAARAGQTVDGEFGRLSFHVEELQERIGGGLIPALADTAEVASAAFAAAHKVATLDVTPGFDLPGPVKGALNFGKFVALAPALAGPVTATRLIADQLGDSNSELSITERMATSVADQFERLAGALDKVGDKIQSKLRARMLEALADVEEKALDSFDGQTDAMLSAHDKATDGMLRAFDKRTDELLEKMRVVVKVGGRQFEIGRDGQTPAERELEALDKIEAKRNASRALFDARQSLGQALLIGDPEQIRQAKRAVEDAETDRKKIKLQARAETEREAADKALAEEERALRESRDAQRRDLDERRRMHRDHLADRRSQMRENLQEELAAQRKALENGKRAAANSQKQILAILRSYKADYKGVGKDLGGKFLDGFREALGIGLEVKPVGDPNRPGSRGVPGAASGGIAGQLGVAGPSDTVLARLTPGEMILTKGDQRMLAQTLGAGAIGWPLLGKIRMGFAEGGVADDDLLRMLLQRFSGTLATDAVKRGTALADPRLLKGGLSAAEARALSPVHIQSLVKHSLGARYASMTRSTKLRLLNELAQRQAHPQRAGLIRVPTGGGYERGRNFRDPSSVYSPGNFSMGDINISGGHSNWGTAQVVRRELIRHANRNTRRRRGRNAGSRVGLA